MEIPAWLLVTGAFLVVASLFVYGRLIRRIAHDGGKVCADHFGISDLVLAALLIAWFLSAIIRGFSSAPRPVHNADLVSGAMLFLFIVAFLGSFMHFRGIDLAAQFGFRRMRPGKVLAIAAGLLLAAYPLVACMGALTQKALGNDAKPQELVRFFLHSAEKSDYSAMIATMLIGVLLAPMAEEFIFRGYFYGALKSRLGIVAGIVLNAALFAAIHLNESSLPTLFALAVCFTLAYEATGSILVCMAMHSLFNFANLSLLLLSARHSAP